MELPETTRDITVSWLNQVLHENGFFDNVNIASMTRDQMSVGFLSDMARLEVSYDRHVPTLPETMIAKLPPSREPERTMALRNDRFANEIRFYMEIAPIISIRTPGLIFGGIDSEKQRHVMLLQDCSHFTEADPQLEGLSYEQTRIVVLKMADFHARWWGGRHSSSYPWLPVFGAPATPAIREANINIFRNYWDACALRDDFRKILPEGGWEAGLKIYEQRPWLVDSAPADKQTMIHADLRSDNMFFDWNSPQDPLILFDWNVRIGRGMRDLSFLLGYSLAPELRRQIEREMLRLYYDRLVECGVTSYSFSESWTDYLRGLITSVAIPIQQLQLAQNSRGITLARASLERMFSAIVDNDATSILP